MTIRAPLITSVRGAVNLTNLQIAAGTPLALRTAPPVIPLKSLDWPNPVLRKDARASTQRFEQSLFQTTLAQVPVLLQGVADEKQFVRISDRAAQSFVPLNIISRLTSLPVIIHARAPLITRVEPRGNRTAQLQFSVNLLETTLTPPAVTQPPSVLPDTHIIRQNPSASLQFVPVNLLNTLQNPAVTDRFSSTYWGFLTPPPRRGQVQDSQNVTLTGITPGPLPLYSFDWPNPVRAKLTVFADQQQATFLLNPPPGTTPPFAKDFPNPQIPRPAVYTLLQGPSNLSLGIPVGSLPFSSRDFPNPNRRPSVPPDTSNTSFALRNTPVVLPIGETSDWALTPIRYVPRTAYFEGNNGILPIPVQPPTAGGNTRPYGDRVILPAKKLGEKVFVPVDFISKLGPTETIVSAVCTITVYTGIDPSPAAMLVGSPQIAGTIVEQLTQGGVVGTIYEFLAAVTTSLGQVIELPGFLAVIPDLP